MLDEPASAISALEPLYAPHEEPTRHRVRGEAGGPARIVPHRRPTAIPIAQNLRGLVRHWRATDYPGASETTRELLHHWFGRDHVLDLGGGSPGAPSVARVPFRYYFCQREAIETLIYLYEVAGLTSLSALTAEFTSRRMRKASRVRRQGGRRWASTRMRISGRATPSNWRRARARPR